MKRRFAAVVLLFAALSAYGQSRGTVSLDEAIRNSAQFLIVLEQLPKNARVAFLDFSAPNKALSDYILPRLESQCRERFTIVDRANIELRRQELDLSLNYETSQETELAIGKMLSAECIVTGSLIKEGNTYTLRLRPLITETGETFPFLVENINGTDKRITALLRPEPDVAEKIGTGALNIAFGLGSYLEGDIFGGVTISAGYGLAATLFIIEATALDWDSPAVGVPATIGVGVAGLTLVYGFVRPFIYNRSPYIAAVMDNIRPGVVFTSDEGAGKNRSGFQLTYTIKF